jgi:hypothetical protein
MTQIDCLNNYKKMIINTGETFYMKKYLENSFSRWFFDVERNDLLPKKNIINFDEAKNDYKSKDYGYDNYKNLIKVSNKAFQELLKCFPIPDIKYTSYDKTLIKDWQLERLTQLHKNDENLESDIAKIVSLYDFVGMNNIHLSVPPIFEGVEMFGTPLNTHNKEFCSPFEIDKKFGSLGSVWDYKFHKDGIYLCDPPYDAPLIERIAKKLNKDLDETKFKVAVLIVIPVWDSKTQKELGIKDYGLDFAGFEIMLKSKYYNKNVVLDQEKYKYWSYYEEKKIPACWTHYILLTKNMDLDINTYVKKWELWSASKDTIRNNPKLDSKTQIECLNIYKNKIINSTANIRLRRYYEKAISRWYFNIDKDDLLPKRNIINYDEIKIFFKEENINYSVYQNLINISKQAFTDLLRCFPVPDIKYESYDLTLITKWQLERLNELYIGNDKDSDIAKLVNLYDFIGMNSIHLSTPPIFKGIEMFGSPLNTNNKEFCSPFKIEEKFGSLGSIWNYKFHKDGIYLCNPPYDDILIEKLAYKLIKDLDETEFKVAILIVIPVWDSKTQKELGIKDYGLDFAGYEIIISNKYFKKDIILDQYKYKFWDYYLEQKIPAVSTHYILLSKNKDININDYIEKWKEWSEK